MTFSVADAWDPIPSLCTSSLAVNLRS
jgi:hypothetical protein